MFKKEKRGQSNIIVAVLLILIILVIVAIVWLVIRGTVKHGAEDVSVTGFILGAEIDYFRLIDNYTAEIRLTRSSGKGNITGVKFIFEDSKRNTYSYENDTLIPEELESKTYIIKNDSLSPLIPSFLDITKVSVYYTYKNEANAEKITQPLDTQLIELEDISMGYSCSLIWTDTTEFRCSSGIRQVKQTNNCDSNTQWVVRGCSSGYVCYDGENSPSNKCINKTQECTDVELGIDYNTKGFANKSGSVFWDVCSSSNLTEYYCYYNSSDETEVRNNKINCEYGCSDGRCLPQQCTISSECSSYNLAAISSCTNNPDNKPLTFDYAPANNSLCISGLCTIPTQSVTSSCNKTRCGAECDLSNNCANKDCDYLDGCYIAEGDGKADDYYNYSDVSVPCLSNCSCGTNSCLNPAIIYNDSVRCSLCNDGIQNQDETGIDCGGICINKTEICNDGIDNNKNCLIDEDCQTESWAFITISDTYSGLEGGLRGSLISAFRDNSDLKFIISTGDIENNQQIDNYIQSDLDIYFPNQSVVPWFEALGNHNIEDVTDLQFIQNIIGSRLKTQLIGMTNLRDGPYKEDYNWTGKNFTYSFDYKNAHFIIMNDYYGNTLNPNPLACVWDENYEWLKNDLEQNTKPLIFIFGHEPAFPTDGGQQHCGDSLEDPGCPNNSVTWRQIPRPMRDKFWQLLNDYNVTAHFVGHEHTSSARQVYNYSDFNLTTCDEEWNCYCNEEYKLPQIANNTTIFPGKVIEYNNGITRTSGPVNIIRINETRVTFSKYWRNSTNGLLVLTLVFNYEFTKEQKRTVYVDNSLLQDCTDYNEDTRTCGTGDKIAYKSLANATSFAVAGDTVLIRAGTYNEIFKPINSGTLQNAITYKNYNNEGVVIRGTAYDARAASCPEEPNLYYGPIWIEYINYTIVDGLNFSNMEGFGRITRSRYNTFKNCNFDGINSGWIIGLNLFESSNNRFENNKFEGAADNFRLIHSDNNIIQGNNFHNASHVLLTLKCSSYNIVRNNYFYNEIQKAMEVFDCEQPTMEDHYNIYCQSISILNSTKHNIIENNEFAYTAKDKLIEGYPEGPFNGIQYAGQEGIIRKNVFYDNRGGGLGLTRYSQEAEYDNKNRIYNNVFYKNRFAGIQISSGANFYDNVLKNNILYKNDFVNWDNAYDLWGWQNASGKPFQIWVKTSASGYLFDRNNILNQTPAENHIIAHADDYESGLPANRSLAWWQQTHASNFANNTGLSPLFVNADAHDFNLQSGSPMIDAGAFLTNTTSAGSGTVMQVSDVRYFYDGYGIKGEQGDIIQLDGQTSTARILNINYATNTLTLDNSLTWSSGQKLGLAYSGTAPDVGIYEYQGVTEQCLQSSNCFYVSVTGAGIHDGSSGNEMNLSEAVNYGNARTGEAIIFSLRNGNYGNISFINSPIRSAWLEWKATAGENPVFEKIIISNSNKRNSYMKFEGLIIQHPRPNPMPPDDGTRHSLVLGNIIDIYQADNIEVNNCRLKGYNRYLSQYAFKTENANNIVFYGNDISNTSGGFYIYLSNNTKILNNYIHNVSEGSGIRILNGCFNTLIESNHVYGQDGGREEAYFPYDGDWHPGSGMSIRSDNMVIRNNIVHDGYSQGLMFYSDAGIVYDNIILENNVFYDTGKVPLYNCGENISIIHNTFIGFVNIEGSAQTRFIQRYTGSGATLNIYNASGYNYSGISMHNNLQVTNPSINLPDKANNFVWTSADIYMGLNDFRGVWINASNNLHGNPNIFEDVGFRLTTPEYNYATDGIKPFFANAGFYTQNIEWSPGTTYSPSYAGDPVRYRPNGKYYQSLQVNNLNHSPVTSPTWWQENSSLSFWEKDRKKNLDYHPLINSVICDGSMTGASVGEPWAGALECVCTADSQCVEVYGTGSTCNLETRKCEESLSSFNLIINSFKNILDKINIFLKNLFGIK